jgi:hypothetical protein
MSKTLMEKLNDLASKAGFKFESKEGKVELSKIATVKLSAEAKLQDGTMIATTADAWGPGVDILVVDAEGKTTPAMDGEYKLETGETVVVVDGLVSEIRPMEVEEEVEMEAEISARFEALANRIAALETQNTELSTQLASVTESKTNAETKLKATEKQLVELSKKPAASSVKEVALGKEKPKHENAKKPLAQMSMTERVIANMKHN